ncbi:MULTISPECIES: hypothetical protein [unclassified Phaeobacter]|uniref:hypothetical protein n=1 Tax=unclassified Phaeobacter TaxID=2621772 RepID=UPI003A88D792
MHKQLSILMISLGATLANAEEFCVVPVAGSEPKLPVEFEQPYRIATSPRTVPGFDGMIVKALNRHELYEFNGLSLSLVEEDFPHVWGFAFEHGIHVGPDGEAFGFGSRPRVIFRLGSNESSWEPIETTQGYERAFFDQSVGDVYWQATSSDPMKWIKASGASEEVDLPVFNGDQTVSIRTIGEINGALALTGPLSSTPRESSSLWFRPLSGEWTRISVDLPEGQRLLPTFQDAKVEVGNGIIRIFPSNNAFEPLIFRVFGDDLKLVASLPAGTWEYHAASGNWIGRVGPWSHSRKTSFGLWQKTPETLPPHFLMLGPDETEAHLIPGLTSQSDVVGKRIFYHPSPISIPEETRVFVNAGEGIMVLDGASLSQIQMWPYEKIGEHPDVKSLGGVTFIQSERGVFVLNDNLSLHRVANFPVEAPWRHEVRIDYVEAWQTYLVTDKRSGEIYVSKDMERFTKLESEQRVTGVVGLLPEPTSVLVIGEDQLYAVKQGCAP